VNGSSNPVFQFTDAFLLGTVRRAKQDPCLTLDAVSNNPAPAMITRGSQCVDGTLKTVERMFRTGHGDFKSLVILIPADFTCAHIGTSIISKSAIAIPPGNLVPATESLHQVLIRFSGL
jgi:hypothetical protein